MTRLLILIVAAALAWSGYWAVAAWQLRQAQEDWFAARRAEGWQAAYADLAVRGFPNRLDSTFTDVALADPESGLAWRAPLFQMLRLSYRPNHVIAAWSGPQTLATPERRATVESERMRASLVLRSGAPRALDRATFVAEGVRVVPETGGAWALAGLNAAAERTAASAARYRLGLSLDGLAPPGAPERLPQTLEAVRLDATVTFDAPWDAAAVAGRRPQPERIEIDTAEARWGDLRLSAQGRLEVDAAGVPEGRIDLRAENWRAILRLAETAAPLPPGLTEALEEALALAAGLSGDPETLDLPLAVTAGQLRLGPVPLGPAPRLLIR
jgi:hypothetical protein